MGLYVEKNLLKINFPKKKTGNFLGLYRLKNFFLKLKNVKIFTIFEKKFLKLKIIKNLAFLKKNFLKKNF
ncbi:MAG: hypothetical protein B6I24_01480 [Bacteroidetes bacterium 4572_128]|nr:MAG: hypothetical protein B6I24_01480 [Bacteroidetes bacterium 4572_128]